MIQDIARRIHMTLYSGGKKPEDRDYLLHYEYNKVMLLKADGVIPPSRGTGGGRGFFG